MLIEDVKAELIAEWNHEVIAVNNIYIGSLTETVDSRKVPEVKVLPQIENMNPQGNGSAEIGTEQFIVEGYAKLPADLDKLYGEAKRIINAKYIAGGWWRVITKIIVPNVRFLTVNITCNQVLFQLT